MALIRYFKNGVWSEVPLIADGINPDLKIISDQIITNNFNPNLSGDIKNGDSISVAISKLSGKYNSIDLTPFITKVDANNTFVTKVVGKDLSTNDFTDVFKTKLQSLYNYTLPVASSTVLGGVKINPGYQQFIKNYSDGSLYLDTNYLRSLGDTTNSFSTDISGLTTNIHSDTYIDKRLYLKNGIGMVSGSDGLLGIYDPTQNSASISPAITLDTKNKTMNISVDKAKELIPNTIVNSTDLNTVITTGNYKCISNASAATLINSPTVLAFVMEVLPYNSYNTKILQRITVVSTGDTYIRSTNTTDNTFTSWVKQVNGNDLYQKYVLNRGSHQITDNMLFTGSDITFTGSNTINFVQTTVNMAGATTINTGGALFTGNNWVNQNYIYGQNMKMDGIVNFNGPVILKQSSPVWITNQDNTGNYYAIRFNEPTKKILFGDYTNDTIIYSKSKPKWSSIADDSIGNSTNVKTFAMLDDNITGTAKSLTSTAITTASDLNTYKSAGSYYYSDASTVSGLLNCPVSNPFTMNIVNYNSDGSGVIQTIVDKTKLDTYTRSLTAGTWSSWVKESNSNDLYQKYTLDGTTHVISDIMKFSANTKFASSIIDFENSTVNLSNAVDINTGIIKLHGNNWVNDGIITAATINATQINTDGLKVTKNNPLYLGNNTTIIGKDSTSAFDVYGKASPTMHINGEEGTHTFAMLDDTITGKAKALTAVEILPNTDINTLYTTGWYYCPINTTASTLVNAPSTNSFIMQVVDISGTDVTQIVVDNTGKQFTRHSSSSHTAWSSWLSGATAQDLTNYLPLSGGTLTGNVNITKGKQLLSGGANLIYLTSDNITTLGSISNNTLVSSKTQPTWNNGTGSKTFAMLTDTVASANVLSNPRKISGIIFDGSEDINIPFSGLISKPTTISGYGITDSYTKSEVDNKVSTVYKPAGSSIFANLPTPAIGILGNVYNVTDAFTTTDIFIEGAGKPYPAGTNIVVIPNGEGYAYDTLSGFIDLSPYAKSEDLSTVATTGIYADLKNKPLLSAIATSGAYADLTGVPTKVSQFTNDSAYITSSANITGTASALTLESLSDTDDLNNFVTAGLFVQETTANATIALHYPTVLAGYLQVLTSGINGLNALQYYTTYDTGLIYYRAFDKSKNSWTAWNYVTNNTMLSKYLPLSGGTLTGNVNMAASTILTGLSTDNISHNIILIGKDSKLYIGDSNIDFTIRSKDTPIWNNGTTVKTIAMVNDVPTKVSQLANDAGYVIASGGTVTNAINDGDGNKISTTYLKLSGGVMSGHIIMAQNAELKGYLPDGTTAVTLARVDSGGKVLLGNTTQQSILYSKTNPTWFDGASGHILAMRNDNISEFTNDSGYITSSDNITGTSSAFSVTDIPQNTDLNSLTTSGWYKCTTDTIAASLINSPISKAFVMEVIAYGQNKPIQRIVTIETRNMWVRSGSSLNWYEWLNFTTSTDVNNYLPLSGGVVSGPIQNRSYGYSLVNIANTSNNIREVIVKTGITIDSNLYGAFKINIFDYLSGQAHNILLNIYVNSDGNIISYINDLNPRFSLNLYFDKYIENSVNKLAIDILPCVAPNINSTFGKLFGTIDFIGPSKYTELSNATVEYTPSSSSTKVTSSAISPYIYYNINYMEQWSPKFAYKIGTCVNIPKAIGINATGILYLECIKAGISANNMNIDASIDINATIVDGTVNWALRNQQYAKKLETPITIAGVDFDGASSIVIPFNKLANIPTTISGYGITDAYTKDDLSTVATTGKYSDLIGIPTKVSQFTNDANYVTSAGNITGTAKSLSATAIPSAANLNTYTAVGWYYCATDAIAATITNSASAKAFTLEVIPIDGTNAFITQRLTVSNTGDIYIRTYQSGTLSSWVKQVNGNDLYQKYVVDGVFHKISDKMELSAGTILSGNVSFPSAVIDMSNATSISTGGISLTGSNWNNSAWIYGVHMQLTGNAIFKNNVYLSTAPVYGSDNNELIVSSAGSTEIGSTGNKIDIRSSTKPTWTTTSGIKTFAMLDDNITGTAASLTRNAIPSSSDLNSYSTTGWYYASSNAIAATITNSPTTNAFILEVIPWGTTNGIYILQRVTNYNTGEQYTRYLAGVGSWGNWKKQALSSDLSNYIPKTGGEITGDLKIDGTTTFQNKVQLVYDNTLNSVSFKFI